jgi:archaetidylinositol phosphate synthase
VEPFLEPMARALIKVDPKTISLIALILAALAGACLYLSPGQWEVLLPVAALLIIISGFLDALDGKVARLVGKSGRRGDFLDHVLDRYADVFMIGGVAVSAWCHPLLGISAIIGVLLTSYMGTQAQAVGVGRMYTGLLGRADRVVILFLASIVQWILMFFNGGWFDVWGWEVSVLGMAMLYFAVVGNLTAVQRAWKIWKRL